MEIEKYNKYAIRELEEINNLSQRIKERLNIYRMICNDVKDLGKKDLARTFKSDFLVGGVIASSVFLIIDSIFVELGVRLIIATILLIIGCLILVLPMLEIKKDFMVEFQELQSIMDDAKETFWESLVFFKAENKKQLPSINKDSKEFKICQREIKRLNKKYDWKMKPADKLSAEELQNLYYNILLRDKHVGPTRIQAQIKNMENLVAKQLKKIQDDRLKRELSKLLEELKAAIKDKEETKKDSRR